MDETRAKEHIMNLLSKRDACPYPQGKKIYQALAEQLTVEYKRGLI